MTGTPGEASVGHERALVTPSPRSRSGEGDSHHSLAADASPRVMTDDSVLLDEAHELYLRLNPDECPSATTLKATRDWLKYRLRPALRDRTAGEGPMTEERSCEEAFDAWIRENRGWHMQGTRYLKSREAFIAGAAWARTPTLPAGGWALGRYAGRKVWTLAEFYRTRDEAGANAQPGDHICEITFEAGDRPPAEHGDPAAGRRA